MCSYIVPFDFMLLQSHSYLLSSRSAGLNMPLNSFPEDGGPLILFGDFNIHLEKLMSRLSVMKDPTAVRCPNKNFYCER